MTDPVRRTIDEVAAPYENFLIPIPATADDVCSVCHSTVYDGWGRCSQCNKAGRAYDGREADAVASIALAPVGEQLARTLYAYKNMTIDEARRLPLRVGLAAVLYKWLARHETCLATAAGVASGRFDQIITVPSTSGRVGKHPLEAVVTDVVDPADPRFAQALVLKTPGLGVREFSTERFVANEPVSGSVLVVDDTWTTGAKAQSASYALKVAGAERVAVLTLGRWWTNHYRENDSWLRKKRRTPWSWESCCVGVH